MKHEKKIIELVAKGCTAFEISKEVGTTLYYAKNLLERIKIKHGAKNAANLVYIAVQKKIIK